MNIFEQIDDIVVKKENRLANNLEDESEFIPYMLQRWLSMYSPQYAEILNISVNKMWKVMEDKQMWYKFFTAIVPRGHPKHIAYIKKAAKTPQKKINDEIIKILSEQFELSQREIKLYIEDKMIDISNIKKQNNL